MNREFCGLDANPPAFVIGVPRSGTTAVFEALCRHPDVAWVSNYAASVPQLLCLNALRRVFENDVFLIRGAKDQFKEQSALRRLLVPRPAEAYRFWNRYARPDFARSYLLNSRPTALERQKLTGALESVARYQQRPHLLAKLTGPGRIGYLSSAVPRARFVHVIRDGLDVVRSLLNVRFWRERGGLTQPWWVCGLRPEDLAIVRDSGNDPGVLAAVQWKRIIDTTRSEASRLPPSQYRELRYETFVSDPSACVDSLFGWLGLGETTARMPVLRTRNRVYAERWNESYTKLLLEAMAPTYTELGYRPSTPRER